MEKVILKNDKLTVGVKLKGAELCSVYHNELEKEFLWQADASIWGRHAPVLFPIVGQVQGGEYTYKGKQYKLSQHGFARDAQFELKEVTENAVSLLLKSDEKTLEVYPFEFELELNFSLEGDKVKANYVVRNKTKGDMYFSLGLHPGFVCPLAEGTSFDDYYIEFEQNEKIDRQLLDGPFLSGERVEDVLGGGKKLALNYPFFDDDAIIVEGFKSKYITIKSDKTERFVEMGLEGFPLLGIWSMPKQEAPYVCLEPWYGVADEKDSGKTYDQKKGIQHLAEGESFSCAYYVTVG